MAIGSCIDYNLCAQNIYFYIAIFLLICSHFIHYAGSQLYEIIFFKMLFILSYLVFIIHELFTKGRIHIANIIGRGLIILMVMFSIYSDVKHQKIYGTTLCNKC